MDNGKHAVIFVAMILLMFMTLLITNARMDQKIENAFDQQRKYQTSQIDDSELNKHFDSDSICVFTDGVKFRHGKLNGYRSIWNYNTQEEAFNAGKELNHAMKAENRKEWRQVR